MSFDVFHDGYLRRITIWTPPDWFTEVEQGRPLMMMVLMSDGRIADHGPGVVGMSTLTGVADQLIPLGVPDGMGGYQTNPPQYSLDPGAPIGFPVLWPKYVAVFVEGIDPTEQPGREVRGFSHRLEPHDHGTLEWMYPWQRTSELSFLEQAATLVATQLTNTWTDWYGVAPPTTYGTAVDPGQVFLVATGRATNMALSALKSPMFSGAALLPGTVGGTAGGRKMSLVPAAGLQVFDLPTPLLQVRGKAIFAICGDLGRMGGFGDNALFQRAIPAVASYLDLTANGDALFAALDERAEHSVIGSLRPWWQWMGLPDPPTVQPQPFPPSVFEATTSTGVRSDGFVKLWYHTGLLDTWPSLFQGTADYEGITEIYKFFAANGPHG